MCIQFVAPIVKPATRAVPARQPSDVLSGIETPSICLVQTDAIAFHLSDLKNVGILCACKAAASLLASKSVPPEIQTEGSMKGKDDAANISFNEL